MAFMEAIHPDDLDAVRGRLSDQYAGQSFQHEYRIIRPDGSIRWIFDQGFPVADTDGKIRQFVGLAQDITARKAAEQSAELASARYQNLWQASRDGIWRVEAATGRIQEVNDAGCAITGYSREALLALRVSDIDVHDSVETVQARTSRIPERGWASFETQHRTRDGRILDVEVTLFPDTLPGQMICFTRDISARKRNEDRLAKSADTYRRMLQTTKDAFWVADAHSGQLLEVNERAVAMLGFSHEELLSKLIADFDVAHSPEEFREHIQRIQAAGGEIFETQQRHASGAIIDVEISTTYDAVNGRYLAFIRDISERKRQEQALRIARETADKANAAKSQFLAHMSHEIRTPMNGVLGMAQVLEYESLTPEQHGMVNNIRAAGTTLLGIINDVLDFSRIEAGGFSLDARPFQLTEVLADLDSMLAYSAQAKGLGLRFESTPAVAGQFVGDALRIKQILFNLIGNALKFTEVGAVTVRALAVDHSPSLVRMRVEVEDTGIGMDMETASHLFQPFRQADDSITRRFGGTGLGLSISKVLVELMDGEIGCTSAPSQGSRFWFEIPLPRMVVETASPPVAAVAPTAAAGLSAAGLRVLAVDDNRINLLVVEKALKREGAAVTLAADGQ